MNIIDILEKKKNAEELSKEEIKFFIDGYTNGEITDYQAAAFVMAICINGMTVSEIVDLTKAMADSGEVLDLTGIADNTVLSDYRVSADESALPHLRLLSDYARSLYVGGVEYNSVPRYPDILSPSVIFVLIKFLPQLLYIITYHGEYLPRVVGARKKLRGVGFIEIKQVRIFYLIHKFPHF